MSARLEEARSALRAGDAVAARRLASELPATGDVLEVTARSCYVELEFSSAIEHYERSYELFRNAHDFVGAGRVAAALGYVNGMARGDWAVASGWISRAQTLLGDEADSGELGWVEMYRGMFEDDRARKNEHFRRSLEIGRTVGDRDLELQSLAYLGASLVHGDLTEVGMRLLDEAMAGAAGREIDDFLVLNAVFCQLYAACEYAHDVDRADQWIRAARSIAERRRLPVMGAFCHTHYGGILTDAGRWSEADATLTEALRLWSLGHRRLRGAAQARLAHLRARQGRIEEAEVLLGEIDLDYDAARPAALVHLAKGEHARAIEVLRRSLGAVDPSSTAAAPLWGLLVDASLAAGDTVEARAAAERLRACAEEHPSDYVAALAAFSEGRLAAAVGDVVARRRLRDALAGFERACLPFELAICRFELASLLASDDPQVALAEARAALDSFERLDATRHVDAATALLRKLGVRPSTARRRDDVLTKREAEVLDLVGHGLSNPEIAERLFISRKTVEHHLGNIFAKFGFRTRAQAAAHAAAHAARAGTEPGPE